MSSRSRAWAAFLLLYGALLAWQVDRWCFTHYGLVSSWSHRPAAATVAAASPRPVQQTFVMGADGLDGLWLDARTDGRLPVGELIVDLHEVTPAGAVRLARASLPAADAVQGGRVHVPFRPIRASRGHRYRVDVRHLHAEPGPSIELGVTRDDELRRMPLAADGVEQWGDLVMQTTSRRATLPYWMHEILAPWPAWVRSPATIAGAVALMNLLLAWACALSVGLSGRRVVTTDAATVTERGADALAADRPVGRPGADGRLHRSAMLATGLVVATGLVITLWPTPAARTLDLIALLPEAAIETTWPLHDGVSRQSVVFGGIVRRTLIAMPTSRIAWTIDVPPGAVFRGGAAMRPDMWTRNSDGIQMAITVEHSRGQTLMTQLTLFPMGVAEHRKLFPVEVPLHPWAGQRVILVLETTPERWGNAVNDVPVWVEPRVEWPHVRGGPPARVVHE